MHLVADVKLCSCNATTAPATAVAASTLCQVQLSNGNGTARLPAEMAHKALEPLHLQGLQPPSP